jgi:hypothetical protein
VSASSLITAARQTGFQAKLLNELASGTLRPPPTQANQIRESVVAEPQLSVIDAVDRPRVRSG